MQALEPLYELVEQPGDHRPPIPRLDALDVRRDLVEEVEHAREQSFGCDLSRDRLLTWVEAPDPLREVVGWAVAHDALRARPHRLFRPLTIDQAPAFIEPTA
jgi:hypothetical protein